MGTNATACIDWENDAGSLPAVARCTTPGVQLAGWAHAHTALIAQQLRACGAILFRGFDVRSQADFDAFANAVAPVRLAYVYRSTPRTSVGERLYTATEYPHHATIPLHCENAYQSDWPMKLLLCCLVPAPRGGETTLANNVGVTERIGVDLTGEFARRKVLYVRNYDEYLDIPWQTVFQTDRRDDVERFCAQNGIALEWKADGGLRTKQVCQGVAVHPHTGQEVWFNQAHLFHVSSLDPKTRAAMQMMFDERDFPRNAYFGDGAPIPVDALERIRQAYQAEMVAKPWQAGDILLIDNMLVAHGRTPYEGDRKVLVAMSEPARAHSTATTTSVARREPEGLP